MPFYSDFESATLTDNGMAYVSEQTLLNKLVFGNISSKPLLNMLTMETLGGSDDLGLLVPSEQDLGFEVTKDGGSALVRKWYPIIATDKATSAGRVLAFGRTVAAQTGLAPSAAVEKRTPAESYSSGWHFKIEMTQTELESAMGDIGRNRLAQNVFMEKVTMRSNNMQDKMHNELSGTQGPSATRLAGMLYPLQNNAVVHTIDQATTAGWQANVVDLAGGAFNDDTLFTQFAAHKNGGRELPTLGICSKHLILSRVRQTYKGSAVVMTGANQPKVLRPSYQQIICNLGDRDMPFACDENIATVNNATAAIANSISFLHTPDFYVWITTPRSMEAGQVGGDMRLVRKAGESAIYERFWYWHAEQLCKMPFNQMIWKNVAA